MNRLTVIGEVNPITGYGQHIMAFVRAAQELGTWCSIRATKTREAFGAQVPSDILQRFVSGPQPEPHELIISPPHVRPTPGKRTTYWTMWESTRLPGYAVENLNLAETVVVPSRWCRDNFMDSGVQAPIEVVPLGIDAAFRPQPWPTTDKFIFGAAGRTRHGRDRKGLDGVVRAFCAAFPYDQGVQLQIKIHPDCEVVDPQDPRVTFIRQHASNEELVAWLRGIHCFVSASCGEGFGLWPLQAMATGRPCILSLYGGVTEYATPQNSFEVAFREVDSSEHFGGRWAAVDLEHVMKLMAWAVKWPYNVKRMGVEASRVGGEFDWPSPTKRVLSIVHHDPIMMFPHPGRSVIQQAQDKGWAVRRFQFEHDPDEVVFNPSVVQDGTSTLWFARRSIVKAGTMQESGVFGFGGHLDFVEKRQRHAIVLPGIRHDGHEDPRVSIIGDNILMSYTKVHRGMKPCQEAVMLDDDLTVVQHLQVPYGGNGTTQPEKNWVWFRHDGALHFVYWIEPMTVVRVQDGEPAEVYVMEKKLLGWRHGVRHGGSHPVLLGDEYFGFCHSLLPWWGRDRSRYFASAYAFSAKPPFGLTRLSRVPFLFSQDDWSKNPCSCVIVGGAILNDGVWTLAVGARDAQCLEIKIPHAEILADMEAL